MSCVRVGVLAPENCIYVRENRRDVVAIGEQDDVDGQYE
jgi:hypothetical protein